MRELVDWLMHFVSYSKCGDKFSFIRVDKSIQKFYSICRQTGGVDSPVSFSVRRKMSHAIDMPHNDIRRLFLLIHHVILFFLSLFLSLHSFFLSLFFLSFCLSFLNLLFLFLWYFLFSFFRIFFFLYFSFFFHSLTFFFFFFHVVSSFFCPLFSFLFIYLYFSLASFLLI